MGTSLKLTSFCDTASHLRCLVLSQIPYSSALSCPDGTLVVNSGRGGAFKRSGHRRSFVFFYQMSYISGTGYKTELWLLVVQEGDFQAIPTPSIVCFFLFWWLNGGKTLKVCKQENKKKYGLSTKTSLFDQRVENYNVHQRPKAITRFIDRFLRSNSDKISIVRRCKNVHK